MTTIDAKADIEAQDMQSVLPVTFTDVSYTVQVKNPEGGKMPKKLLNGVTGSIEAGKMTALMGPSGSGKSTLMDVLSGRKSQGKIDGQILFGGRPPKKTFILRYCAYVEQFDSLLGQLTVREMLTYHAYMKRSYREDRQKIKDKVEKTLKDLGIAHVADTIIGTALTKGISGGQAKRVSIGLALVTEPLVLFLDEPTSGLDSFTADEVMTVVKRSAAEHNVTVCCTIHSPSAYCFGLFDKLLMLDAGRVLYSGTTKALPAYFSLFKQKGINLPSPRESEHDVEWIIRVTTGNKPSNPADVIDFVAFFQESGKAEESYRDVQALAAVTQPSPREDPNRDILTKYHNEHFGIQNPVWISLLFLMRFRVLGNFRDPKFVLPRMLRFIYVALLAGVLYVGLGDKTDSNSVISMAAALYMFSSMPMVSAAMSVPTMFEDRIFFYRETADGVMLPVTYILMKCFEEYVILVVTALMVAGIFIGLTNYKGPYGEFFGIFTLAGFMGTNVAFLCSAIVPSVESAQVIFAVILSTLLFFAGFSIPQNMMPQWLNWIPYVNPVRWIWGGFMLAHFNQVTDRTPVTTTGQQAAAAGRQVPTIGDQMKDFYDLNNVSLEASMGILAGLMFSSLLLATLALTFLRFQNK